MFRTITPILSIIIAIVIYFFYTSDTLAEIQLLQAEIGEYDEAIRYGKQYNQKLDSVLNIKRTMSILESDRVNTLVSSDVDEVRLLVDLTEIARSHNMLLGNISVEKDGESTPIPVGEVSLESVSSSDFVEKRLTFGLIGTYSQLKDMLTDIENSLILLEVVGITFTPNEGDLQQFNLEVRTYALRPTV